MRGSALYNVGKPNKMVGRWRSIAAKTASGSGRPGSNTLLAPTQKGYVSELPKP